MNWTPLASSNISAATFDENTSTLYIRFNNGSVYAYPSASQLLYNGLLSAPSKGAYHARFIKNLPNYRV